MIQLQLVPSRFYLLLVLVLHILVGLILLWAGLPLLILLLAVLFLLGSYYCAESSRRFTMSFKKISLVKGEFNLLTRQEKVIKAELRGEVLNSPWLINLKFLLLPPPGLRAQGGEPEKFSLVLFRDSLQAEDWRRLRVFLRTLAIQGQKQ